MDRGKCKHRPLVREQYTKHEELAQADRKAKAKLNQQQCPNVSCLKYRPIKRVALRKVTTGLRSGAQQIMAQAVEFQFVLAPATTHFITLEFSQLRPESPTFASALRRSFPHLLSREAFENQPSFSDTNMRVSSFLAIGASFSVVVAQQPYLGFNSGATTVDRKAKKQSDFEKEFETAQKLKNSPGLFNSVRLYTNIQPETTDTPIEAFPAAVKTNTTLLLGIWCSGTDSIENELNALSKAIEQYGKNFTDLVVGISVGSEDLYRVSESGIRNEAGLGQNADTIVGFIQDTRKKLEGTALSSIPVGHVDTWSSWANETNKAVVDEVDFLGTNLFPYFEDDKGNAISNVTNVFQNALNSTEKAAGGKDVWITETGWPVSGPDFGQAKPSLENAKDFWDTIGCTLFGRKNVWWYVLQDANPDNDAKFGITNDLSTTPQYDLRCPDGSGAPASINTDTSGGQPSDGKPADKSAGSTVSVSGMGIMLVCVSFLAVLAS